MTVRFPILSLQTKMVFASLLSTAVLALPFIASAAPFGGSAAQVVPCYNGAIFANVGAPRGGMFIWTPSTQTYLFGPPSHAGQWLLGLSGVPYYCVVSLDPVIVWPGISITMMGSSGGAAAYSLPPTPAPLSPSELSKPCVVFDWPEDKPVPAGCTRG